MTTRQTKHLNVMKHIVKQMWPANFLRGSHLIIEFSRPQPSQASLPVLLQFCNSLA